ncbi:alpha/beta hydrolase [Lentzea sp. NPDC042327]|uniref:alpha/beta fold hydrolase n=1 Tax=Lentzea sp. NPDC042327 TaxID=3154801 RepID=UPI0033F5A6CB
MYGLRLGDRELHVHDVGEGVPVFWHHGTPNLGLPPEPLFRPGVRWLSYDRPGYGTSTPLPGRSVVSAATDISHIADELGLSAFAVVSYSGGGPHALVVPLCSVTASPQSSPPRAWRRSTPPASTTSPA